MMRRLLGVTSLLAVLSIGAVGCDKLGLGSDKSSKSSKDKDKDKDDDDKESEKKKSVLSGVEKFKAPPCPDTMCEPYDGIQTANSAKAADPSSPLAAGARTLPPTLTDVLVDDIRTIAFYDLKMGKLDAKAITKEQAQKVIDFYASTEWTKLRGFRPWTHKKFIDSLSADDRKKLSEDVVAYLHDKGFKAEDKLPATAPDAPAAPTTAAAPVETPPASGGDAVVYAGTYTSAWGQVTLEQAKATPGEVKGRYPRGTLKCKVTAKLECSWAESSSSGQAAFTREANGDLKGSWGSGASATSGGPWNLKLSKAGELN